MPGDNKYEGLIVTTIDVTPIEGTNKCTFTDDTKNNTEKAFFLKDIVMKPGKAPREFEATIVSTKEAREIVNAGTAEGHGKPLFCIHGFNVEPSETLFNGGCYTQAANGFGVDKKFFTIPVQWASLGDTLEYQEDQQVSSVNAGKALRGLVNSVTKPFPAKSLLCHSMGNRVLGQASIERSVDAHFDNIFMVAADVPHDLFHGSADEAKKEKAKNIFSMLDTNDDGKPKGKVYVLHNENDLALRTSGFFNQQTRVGCVGNSMKKKWGWFGYSWEYDESLTDDLYKGYIENVNCKDFKMKDSMKHGYQFEPEAIDTYEAKYV